MRPKSCVLTSSHLSTCTIGMALDDLPGVPSTDLPAGYGTRCRGIDKSLTMTLTLGTNPIGKLFPFRPFHSSFPFMLFIVHSTCAITCPTPNHGANLHILPAILPRSPIPGRHTRRPSPT